ncbi:MAG: helicase HerA domain-containing protein [bacterium]
MEKTKPVDIGHCIEVQGERMLIELTVDTTKPLAGDYYPGQPGSYIKIPFRNQEVIGIVSKIKMQEKPVQEMSRVADCVLLGTLNESGRFLRGVTVYPTIGQVVQMVKPEELARIFSEFIGYDFSFGSPTNTWGQRVYVHVDRFFGQHIAVLGTTGSGKSCTVVSILQQAVRKYPNAHIVVLDLHGEYAAAFPEKVNIINTDTLELPYWLLNFDEFVELCIDMSEPTAKNQITVLHDSLIRTRQAWDTRERLGLGGLITADSPVYFDLDEMVSMIRDWNIQVVYDHAGKQEPGPLYGVFDRFLIRLGSKLSDPRYNFMFKPNRYDSSATLPDLLRSYLSIDAPHRMTVVDLSGVPFEAVGVVVAVITRVVFEFNLWNPERERSPLLLVLEEAHNYVPSKTDNRFTAARSAVERVIKEGRKYGIGLIVVSQRPTELSEIVLSQCNTFIAMRLTNPEDQNYIRRLVPDSLAGLLNMLPALQTGEALILGEAVAIPTRMTVDMPDPKPASSEVKYAKWWSDGPVEIDFDRIVKRWRARRQDV